jgi:glycosyltransferase involved in cell wall biosynthesis
VRIVVDARAYFQRTGIARYTRGLVHALAAAAREDEHELVVLISNHHRADEITLPGRTRVVVSDAEWLGGDQERAALAADARRQGADLFHAIFPPLALDEVRTVVTVFDVTPLTHPELHQPVVRDAFGGAWRSLDGRDARLVAVSRATRDAMRAVGAPDPDPAVIGIGVSAPFDSTVEGLDAASRRGLLFVGTLEPRKNAPLVLEVMEVLHRRGRGVPVTLVGKTGWGDQVWQERLQHLPDVSVRGFVSDEELLARYRQAAFLLCPSTVEGFGLPVLEGMAQGVLPLVARTPALSELVADPRLALDRDATAFANAIEWWLDHPEEWESTTRRLTDRARACSWRAVADAWLRLYGSLVYA